ncbi:hypothetical protein [Terribacillus sp. AE2B 122]|uniref:hypothetical protein n=1 Tax=Terribacillus sp. AE2B 122 TaxID=1331902 RepID=UPI00144074E3|nr:hypothetical protein [Terribacillus sp. AE2B 122]VVM34276.1 hypothetical protein [Terribacillus sp. AE2B 122]
MRRRLLEWWIAIPRKIRTGFLGLLTGFFLTAVFIKGWQALLHSSIDNKQVVIGMLVAIALTASILLNKK